MVQLLDNKNITIPLLEKEQVVSPQVGIFDAPVNKEPTTFDNILNNIASSDISGQLMALSRDPSIRRIGQDFLQRSNIQKQLNERNKQRQENIALKQAESEDSRAYRDRVFGYQQEQDLAARELARQQMEASGLASQEKARQVAVDQVYNNVTKGIMTPEQGQLELSRLGVNTQLQAPKDATPQTVINVGEQESEYSKAIGKKFADKRMAIAESGSMAGDSLYQLDALEKAVSTPGVYQGTGAGVVNEFKKFGNSVLGMDFEGLDDAESVKAISAQLMSGIRKDLMPGALSNQELKFLESAVPSLSKTKEGNVKLINYYKKAYERKQEVSELANQYVNQNNGMFDEGFNTFVKDYYKDKPLFTEDEISGKTSTITDYTNMSDDDLLKGL